MFSVHRDTPRYGSGVVAKQTYLKFSTVRWPRRRWLNYCTRPSLYYNVSTSLRQSLRIIASKRTKASCAGEQESDSSG